MADGEEEPVVPGPSSDPDPDADTLLLSDDSPVPEDFILISDDDDDDVLILKPEDDLVDGKPPESEEGPSRQQSDDFPWDRRWSRDRSEESTREKSVDSRDSATRERDLRYAEERKRDRERGRREAVVLYRNSDSESKNKNSDTDPSDSDSGDSETTEEGELKSPKRSRRRSPPSIPTVLDETTTSWEVLPQIAVAESYSSAEKTECCGEHDSRPDPDKEPMVNKDDTSEGEPGTEVTCDSYAAKKSSESPGGTKSENNDCKASRNGAKRRPMV